VNELATIALITAVLAIGLLLRRMLLSALEDLNAATARNQASAAALIAAIAQLPNNDAAIEAAVTAINETSDTLDAATAGLPHP
jgi:hypothetical protein